MGKHRRGRSLTLAVLIREPVGCNGHDKGHVPLDSGARLLEAGFGEIKTMAEQGLMRTDDCTAGGDDSNALVLDTDCGVDCATPADPMANEGPAVGGPLTVGYRLKYDLYDRNRALLLPARTEITPRLLALLKSRRISTDTFRDTDPSTEEPAGKTISSTSLDDLLAEEERITGTVHPVRHLERPRLSIGDLKAEALCGLERHSEAGAVVGEMGELLQRGRSVSGAAISATVESFVRMIKLDFDLLPLIVGMQQAGDEYLQDHCVNVTMLGMSIAAQMGYASSQIAEVGTCAFLQDLGMLRVPEEIRFATRALSDEEFLEVRRHPLYTLDLLENLRGLPRVTGIVAYQSHERCDGTGYPRKLSGMNLLQYTKIVSVADSYAAMSRPRPHRTAMSPYHAAKNTLIEGSVDKFDRGVVRAFLDVVALFPIGSEIGLENGMRARVLRANPKFHTRPVVEEIDADGNVTGRIIDLSLETGARIIQAF